MTGAVGMPRWFDPAEQGWRAPACLPAACRELPDVSRASPSPVSLGLILAVPASSMAVAAGGKHRPKRTNWPEIYADAQNRCASEYLSVT
jgi:hypothetical protein